MYGRVSSKPIMYISIIYRLASVFMMLTMIMSRSLYNRFSIYDSINLLLIGASFVALPIYWQVGKSHRIIGFIVYLETMLLFTVYLFTGGLHSPIIWLVTSPAVFYLFHYKGKTYIITFFIIFALTSFVGPYVIGEELTSNSFMFFPSFIMALTMMLLISMIAKQFRKNTWGLKNLDEAQQLLKAVQDRNHQINHWLNNSYSFVENLLVSDDVKESVQKIFSYSAIVIPAFGFYLYVDSKEADNIYYSSVDVRHLMTSGSTDYKFVEYDVEGVIHYATLGMIFFEEPGGIVNANRNKIELILKITALFFERNELMIENEALLIANEQQRIAEEMHDGLNQDIHGTTFMLYDILNNYKNYEIEQIIEKIQVTYDTILGAGQSLKKTIYQLSRTNKVDEWHEGVMGLVTRLSKQYGIFIPVTFDASTKAITSISPALFDTFRRIIKEAVSNAFEHGGATSVKLFFTKEENTIRLVVKDDGAGFGGHTEVSPGLGMENMRKLTERHRGGLTVVKDEVGGGCIEMRFLYET